MSGGNTEKQIQLIQDFNPDIIMVTPSYMLNIADELERRNVDINKLKLRVGIFGAEPWTDAMRKEIESRMGIDAVDIYGLSEVMGPGVAQECIETKDGPTIWEDHFYRKSFTRNWRSLARWRRRRTGIYQPDQRSITYYSLSHTRPHPLAARHCAHYASHGQKSPVVAMTC